MDIEVGKTSMLKKFLRTGLEVKDDIIRELYTNIRFYILVVMTHCHGKNSWPYIPYHNHAIFMQDQQ